MKFKAVVEKGKDTTLLANLIKARDHKTEVGGKITRQFMMQVQEENDESGEEMSEHVIVIGAGASVQVVEFPG